MAKNQKGKNSKDASNNGGKNGNGKNKGGKQNSVAEAHEPKKAQRPKGPVPNFKRRAKNSETMQTLEGVWNGYHGLVSAGGMQFRFFSEISESGGKTNRICLVSAPLLTKLGKLDDFKTSIDFDALKESSFVSDFEESDKRYEVQVKLWKFWVRTFTDAGYKLSHHKKPDVQTAPASKEVEHKHESKTSSSIADFDLKKKGLYRFDSSEPYAIISVEPLDAGGHAPQFGNPVSDQLVIKLVSVGKGHPLSDCKIGTFLYYNAGLFAKGAPFFKGPSAKDRSALYEYVAGERRRYRQNILDKVFIPSGASQDVTVGAPALSREENHLLRAA